jgi:hypothetical protein
MADQRVKQQPTPAIARIWRGRTTRARADEYQTYRADEGEFLIELPKGVQVLEIVSGNIAVGRGSA